MVETGRDALAQLGDGASFETLAELLPDAAVFAVDAERRIVYWSEGGQALLGFAPADVEGEHCLKANRCHTCVEGCGIARQGTVRDVPLTLYAADGSAVRVRKSARAFFDAQGQFAGGVEVLQRDHTVMAAEDMDTVPSHGIVTQDPGMQTALEMARNVAETDATVLLRGESGTGKDLVAREIHARSHRADGPFVAVNCAALTHSLMESELFGHVRGAFTGAVQDRQGLFRQAAGGTLFLDEVAELSSDAQAKLLRVLENREVMPVGASQAVAVDVRVVAATHRSLRKLVKAGRFREDLMYRLRVVPIFLPPLRERRGDVALLLQHFVSKQNVLGPRVVESVAPDAMRRLLGHEFPGNVRELRNVVEYAFAVGRGPTLLDSELPPEFRELSTGPDAVTSRALPVASDEKEQLSRALQQSGGHLGKAAEQLGVSRATLWRKRKKHGL